ncbi:MAG: hypothetical protein KBT20_01420 [Bacteroidales bacterium]|nr:hypothetical protein [Candidatus Liminaster caballi]
MKKYILAMITLVSLMCTGCTSDEYLGDPQDITRNDAISFDGGTDMMTRAALQGSAAAERLNNSFVVYGFKTTGTNKQVVFDHYTVNFTNGSAFSSETNTAGWEYSNQELNMLTNLDKAGGVQQEIKYWDFAADQYDFVAFSVGDAEQVTNTPSTNQVKITKIDKANLESSAYAITGKLADLAKVYIADRVTARNDAIEKTNLLYPYRNAIQFAFHPLVAMVRIGLYETIPGYSVKDVKFYQQPISASSEVTPYLYAGTQTIPSNNGGTVTVSFPVTDSENVNFNKADVKFCSDGEKTQILQLGTFSAETAAEQSENGGSIYVGRTSSNASKTADVAVIPASADVLTLKVDFTLVSIDYNETIEVKGAMATIPAQFTDWRANCAYTYLFKISDALTNAFGQQLLYPITFDALETVDDKGLQQTITTIDNPSITTYAKGELGSDYYVGDHIYVAVTDGDAIMLTNDNSTLFTTSLRGALTLDDITEKNIRTKIDDGDSDTYHIQVTKDVPADVLTLTKVSGSFMSFTDHIEDEDSPTDERIDATTGSNFAKFTAGNEVYVFRYKAADAIRFTQQEIEDALEGDPAYGKTTSDIKTPTEYHYKVIRIGDARRPLVLPEIPEEEI